MIKVGPIRKSIKDLNAEECKDLKKNNDEIMEKLTQYRTDLVPYETTGLHEKFIPSIKNIILANYKTITEKNYETESQELQYALSSFTSIVQALSSVSILTKIFRENLPLKFQITQWRSRIRYKRLTKSDTVVPLTTIFEPSIYLEAMTQFDKSSNSYNHSFDLNGNKMVQNEMMAGHEVYILPIIYPGIENYCRNYRRQELQCRQCGHKTELNSSNIHILPVTTSYQNTLDRIYNTEKDGDKCSNTINGQPCNFNSFKVSEQITIPSTTLIFKYDFEKKAKRDEHYMRNILTMPIPENLDIQISQQIVVDAEKVDESIPEMERRKTEGKTELLHDILSYKLVAQILVTEVGTDQKTSIKKYATKVRRHNNQIVYTYNDTEISEYIDPKTNQKTLVDFHDTVIQGNIPDGKKSVVYMSFYQYNI